jgi:hypothetical protein
LTAAVGISVVPALAGHTAPQKKSNTHSDTQHHYSYHKHFFLVVMEIMRTTILITVIAGPCQEVGAEVSDEGAEHAPLPYYMIALTQIFNCHLYITNKKMLV